MSMMQPLAFVTVMLLVVPIVLTFLRMLVWAAETWVRCETGRGNRGTAAVATVLYGVSLWVCLYLFFHVGEYL
ncbi:hypothetical protein PP756_gp11 [Pseudomonas phage VB_PaeP_VL1]|uniref:Uncharacterized protein n=1 Tax=Pseudomonas phage VB_PaeP_VL1 TaxID=2894395 RepID=A0AAE8YZC1_9CAUD|nr:hypothetical protein PP756_gp11 [Pseudomonas phage VB_PaeP_VL1]UGV19807.1 hypothetical protein vBPaePVL1_11 [Pseudomonas phage VB_PaeP_VL1]